MLGELSLEGYDYVFDVRWEWKGEREVIVMKDDDKMKNTIAVDGNYDWCDDVLWNEKEVCGWKEVKNQTHSGISHQMKVENVGLEPNMLIKD